MSIPVPDIAQTVSDIDAIDEGQVSPSMVDISVASSLLSILLLPDQLYCTSVLYLLFRRCLRAERSVVMLQGKKGVNVFKIAQKPFQTVKGRGRLQVLVHKRVIEPGPF